MFDTQEDKKALKEAIEQIIKEYKTKKWQSFGRILFVFKIMMMYVFAFIGFSFFFVFLFGSIDDIKNNNYDTSQLQNNIPINIINETTTLEKQYNECKETLNKYTDNCEKYCVQKVFTPICDKYFK